MAETIHEEAIGDGGDVTIIKDSSVGIFNYTINNQGDGWKTRKS
jgi:hypothetical protein